MSELIQVTSFVIFVADYKYCIALLARTTDFLLSHMTTVVIAKYGASGIPKRAVIVLSKGEYVFHLEPLDSRGPLATNIDDLLDKRRSIHNKIPVKEQADHKKIAQMLASLPGINDFQILVQNFVEGLERESLLCSTIHFSGSDWIRLNSMRML